MNMYALMFGLIVVFLLKIVIDITYIIEEIQEGWIWTR